MEKGLRQRRAGPDLNWRQVTLRRAGAPLLAVSLVLSSIPASSLPLLAAPLAWTESEDAGAANEHPEAATTTQPNEKAAADGASSVRPRGREAPVVLRQTAADEQDPPEAVGADPDPGDGPPPNRNQKSKEEEQGARKRRQVNLRVWPLPADSYTFTQAFGCVPQIAHFYQPGAGCPPDRPVVHTGLDLAAPEGTPFYAAASGWVTEAGYDREVGVANTRIIIQHEGRNDGYATEYLHWIASFVDVGDYVEAGQLIGEVGSVGYSTGPHLHFSLIDLDTGEHIDPTRWLPKEPGTEGYRGVKPRRAAMRLPAGTTAGVPEYADPAPPELPTREDLPEEVESGQGRKDRNKRKKAKQREERRNGDNAGKNRNKTTRKVSGKDGSTSENSAASSDDKQADRERERTRKRERNKNGSAQAKDASGENGSGDSRKSGKKKSKSNGNNSNSRKDEKRANRKDKDPVEQTDTREKGKKRNGNNGGGGGNGGKKNRNKDTTQQVDVETPDMVEETPAADPNQFEETGSDRDRSDKRNEEGATDQKRERRNNSEKSEGSSAGDAP
jgi:murein DD-endopeptidase MepM/ murein hydrolase activator NlpD